MILNPEKFIELFDTKYFNYSNIVREKFNVQNNAPTLDFAPRIVQLHQLMISGGEFNKEEFTQEEYDQREILRLDEEERITKVTNGEYLPYFATEEDLQHLVISMEDIKLCCYSQEDINNITNGQTEV